MIIGNEELFKVLTQSTRRQEKSIVTTTRMTIEDISRIGMIVMTKEERREFRKRQAPMD